MKKLFLSFSLSFIILNSCTTTLVSAGKSYSDATISVGNMYTFITSDGKKQALNITKIDEQNIFGKNSEGKELMVEKSKITKIKKTKVGATVALVVGVVALAVIIPAYVNNKPIGQ